MLMVDLRDTNARLTVQEVLASGRRWVSNPFAFSAFVSGIVLDRAELLLDQRWQLPASAKGGFSYFRHLMHELLPTVYDVRHLEALGGRFALRLTGVGDFTVTALNRRVVTFVGLPLDGANGKPVIDVEMRADAFMALCNDLLADLAERTLGMLAASRTAA